MVRKAPTTAISDVMSSSRISISFMCRLLNKGFTFFQTVMTGRLCGGEVVPRAPAGQDIDRVGGVRLDFFPQTADGHVHGAHIVAHIAIVPHLLHQVDAGVDLVGVAGQEGQQLILPLRQVDGFSGAKDLMAVGVDGQVPGYRHGRRRGGGRSRRHGMCGGCWPLPGRSVPAWRRAW